MTQGHAGFTLPVRVYYEDTDAGGVVYHANYLRFMERARTEWLRSLGFDQEQLRSQDHVVFVVARTDVQYRGPARLDDELMITVNLEDQGRAGLKLTQRILKDDELLIHGSVKVACVDTRHWRPALIPRAIRDALSNPELHYNL